jgi:hypothetical protein
MSNYYNDENVFTVTKETVEEKLKNKYILIPVYYGIDDDGQITIDTDSMKEEFERTVYGIESTVDELYVI